MGVFGGGFAFVYEFMGLGLRRDRMFGGTRPAETREIARWREVVFWRVGRMERAECIVLMGVILPVVRSEIRDERVDISAWVVFG